MSKTELNDKLTEMRKNYGPVDRWIESAENLTREKIKTAVWYISEGINPETAIKMVLDKSALGEKYKQIVIAEVRNFAA